MSDELFQYSEICLACEEIHQQVRNEFSPETFRYKETTANYGAARYGFSSKIQKQIGEILNELSSQESRELITYN
ncbi:MAG TPA: hypothetical protein VK203_09735 [Nostocaceae cyanobacterium]|nr:hypothetical protein [Nostocaceae cyanobacterium]